MKRARLSECSCCGGSSERTFIHNVRHRGVYSRLCTACVLKNHPGSFCPICFEVYGNPPPANERAICLNCPSISHLSCVVRTTSKLPPRYQCPPCSNPTFSFFDIRESDDVVHGGVRSINEDKAKQLVAASQIALGSLNKAVAISRVEAERKVKDAVAARKGAKESLERLASLASQEKIESKTLTGGEKNLPVTTHSPFMAEKRGQNQQMYRVQNKGESVKSGVKEKSMPPPFTRH